MSITIAIAGFQHETNSFAKGAAGMAEFEMADSWPGLLSGDAVIQETEGMNLPIAGFAASAAQAEIRLAPILWCAAEPSGPVTDAAFQAISGRILDGIATAGPPDGVYLDLHGAMITESHMDGEGALLRLIRDRFGPELPIAVSLDLHANISQEMVDLADAICVFRTYPHLDMAETGARCLAPLMHVIAGKRRARAFGQAGYLIPLHAQYTGAGPMAELYAQAALEGVELAAGFTAGDTPFCGPTCLAYREDLAEAEAAVARMLARIASAEAWFDGSPLSPDAAVQAAMARPEGLPVVLADVEDNPGGGGASDTTGLIQALVSQGAKGAMLGLLHDPWAAQAAHEAGLGAEITLPLGGRSGCTGDAPFSSRFAVEALSDGRVVYEGAMYGGGIGQIGSSAALRVLGTDADLRIVVSSIRSQCLDRAQFRHLGLEPEAARIIGVKSTVHFRADFDPIAQGSIVVAVPGALSSDPSSVHYKHLRPGVRLGPLGPAFWRENEKTG
ncbi:MAG: M81 family metallopeptidase [Pseudomonadota bacterium]